MGWWKRLRGTRQPPDDSTAKMAFAAIERQQSQFFAALAEKDAQIRMVLEEKFFHPTLVPPKDRPRNTGGIDPRDLEDVAHFPAEGDKAVIAKEEELLATARDRLEKELDREVSQLAAEQAGVAEPTEPVEMLDRVEPALREVPSREERNEAARRHITEGQL